MDAYTTALKNQPFKLVYIDAFAGTGYIEVEVDEVGVDPDEKAFIEGSALIAMGIENKKFDKLVFIEKDEARCQELENLRGDNPQRNVEVKHEDANESLQKICDDWNWKQWRAVLFLDPFGTQVKWETIERVAGTEAIDVWTLFPVSAVVRMLPKDRKPESISPNWSNRLNYIFGSESWRDLYRPDPQLNLLGHQGEKRTSGVDELIAIYKENLNRLFGKRFCDRSKRLLNSKNAPLFEFYFVQVTREVRDRQSA